MGKTDQLQDFLNFNFDKDERFKAYLSRVELMSDNPAVLNKLKGKWYRQTIDVNFDLAWLNDMPKASPAQQQSGRSSQFQSGTTYNSTQAPNPSASASSSQPQYVPRSQPSRGPAVGTRWELYIFCYHVALVLLTAGHFATILSPRLSTRFYKMFLQISIVGQGLKLFIAHNPRQLWPFSWDTARAYITNIAPSSDFHFMILAIAFSNHIPIALMTVPLAVPALYAAMARLATTHKDHKLWVALGSKAYAWLQARQREAQVAAAYCEVYVAFILVFGLLSRTRNFMLTFLYWNLLKMRYHLSDSAAEHRLAWHSLGQRISFIRAKVPIVDKLVGMGQTWFLSVR